MSLRTIFHNVVYGIGATAFAFGLMTLTCKGEDELTAVQKAQQGFLPLLSGLVIGTASFLIRKKPQP